MLRICFSLCASYRRAFVYRRLSRSIIVIQAIHARLRCGRLSCGDKELFWSLGDGDRRRWGKVNWLGRYFCWLEPSLSVTIISVISSSATIFFFFFCCIPGQTDALCAVVCVCVCVCVCVQSPPPPHTLSHTLPITLPDWIYANWTKIKSHLRGDPSWDSFVHTPALARKSHSMISSGFNLQPSRWLVKKHVCSRSHWARVYYSWQDAGVTFIKLYGCETQGETFLFQFSTALFAQKEFLLFPPSFHDMLSLPMYPYNPILYLCICPLLSVVRASSCATNDHCPTVTSRHFFSPPLTALFLLSTSICPGVQQSVSISEKTLNFSPSSLPFLFSASPLFPSWELAGGEISSLPRRQPQ